MQRDALHAGLPARHAITVDEYLRMGEAGILAPDGRYELIAGELIDMPPIGPAHASKTNRLVDLFTGAVRGRASVTDLSRLGIAALPDLVLDCRDLFYPTF
ncbi:MAG: hypothetical protein GVY22_11370 [Gammaproteobacteria bacterium]|nr:hypothetical protein [Gammaproteobacteria bacterium]